VIVLGIETSTPQTSVALVGEQGLLASAAMAAQRGRHEMVVAAVRETCAWAGVELSQVGGIAVGVGPGLFTGLRVGVEAAKSLAQALPAPIVGVGSLDTIAFALRHARRRVEAMIDARRGEIYVVGYHPVPGGVAREGEIRLLTPGAAAAELEATGEDTLIAGNGATLYRREFEGLGGRIEVAPSLYDHPQAAVAAEIAWSRFEREEYDRLYDVVPVYVRKSDAEIAWDRRTDT
jgi:tRNA threonylcarbamoyladenosine biosynthesis protein TsaB